MTNEQIEELYSIFEPMAKAKYADHNYLVRAFTNIIGAYNTNGWRVVGITQAAYDAFKAIDFKRIPTKKDPVSVERAHINQRAMWIKELFDRQWDCPKEWWNFIYDNDKTVFATAFENKQSDQSGIPLVIAYEIPDTGEYFTNQFIGCKYRKKVEKALLESFE